jgi:hypothetical protein
MRDMCIIHYQEVTFSFTKTSVQKHQVTVVYKKPNCIQKMGRWGRGWEERGGGAGFGIPSKSAAWLSNVASPYIFYKDMQGKKRFSNIAFQN